ncbi:hypothetical protein ZWY2020_003359 [Hordeum vulgare]|nr:hypothetical protein ZWY2020_003359 [Hordeum vulgare]
MVCGSLVPPPPTSIVRRGVPTALPMAYIPGEALRRQATSSCKVVCTPAKEAEAHRLRSSALILIAVGHFSGISAHMVAHALERDFHFPSSNFLVAPFFPEDFLLTMFQPAQRDLALEQRSILVARVQFKFRLWLPPDWESVKEVFVKDCELDLIERQSTTKANCSALFAWLWTWHSDKIPRAANFTVLQRPDVVCPRDFLPEGTPTEEGKEGSSFQVLIHLAAIKDFTPASPGRDEGAIWPHTYRFKDKWSFGTDDPQV